MKHVSFSGVWSIYSFRYLLHSNYVSGPGLVVLFNIQSVTQLSGDEAQGAVAKPSEQGLDLRYFESLFNGFLDDSGLYQGPQSLEILFGLEMQPTRVGVIHRVCCVSGTMLRTLFFVLWVFLAAPHGLRDLSSLVRD